MEAVVPGGTLVRDYFAGLDLVPIYIRAGAILPMRSLIEQYVGELNQNPLEIHIYPGANSTYLMYQDDGQTTRAVTNSDFRTTQITQTWTHSQTTVQLTRLHDQFTPPETFYTLRLLQSSQPTSVTADGTALINLGSLGAFMASTTNAYYLDAQTQSTCIKIFDNAATMTVVVRF